MKKKVDERPFKDATWPLESNFLEQAMLQVLQDIRDELKEIHRILKKGDK